MLYDGIATALQIYITIATIVHSQLPAGNDEDAIHQPHDMRRAVDRSCYYHTPAYILDCETPEWDRAFDDTAAAVGEHESTAGVI